MELICIIMLLVLPFVLGGVVDQRNKNEVFKGGSSKIAIGLTTAQAVAAFGDASATGGWYMVSYQMQTDLGPDRDTEELKDEADTLIDARTNRDEFIIQTTFAQTDDDLMKLLDWMEDVDNSVPVRYPLPTQQPAATEEQWVFLYAVHVRKENWRITAANQQTRQRQVTFVATKNAAGKIREIVTLPASQADAAWNNYAAFKDTALP